MLIAVKTGMRMSEIFVLTWSDVMDNEGIVGGKSKAEGRQNALRSDASRAHRRVAAVHA